MDDVRGVTRRTALRTAAGAGVALAAASGGALPAWARARAGRGPAEGPGVAAVPAAARGDGDAPRHRPHRGVMMENHSFDNILGTLPQPARRREVDGLRFRRGRALDANPDAQGARVPRVARADGVPGPRRAVARPGTRATSSYDGGRNDGFVLASGPVAMRLLRPRPTCRSPRHSPGTSPSASATSARAWPRRTRTSATC